MCCCVGIGSFELPHLIVCEDIILIDPHVVRVSERARKLVRENSCDREGDCKGGRIVGGELPEAAERTRELIESKSEIEKGDRVPSIGVREVEES
jgi:hypothetical protein